MQEEEKGSEVEVRERRKAKIGMKRGMTGEGGRARLGKERVEENEGQGESKQKGKWEEEGKRKRREGKAWKGEGRKIKRTG